MNFFFKICTIWTRNFFKTGTSQMQNFSKYTRRSYEFFFKICTVWTRNCFRTGTSQMQNFFEIYTTRTRKFSKVTFCGHFSIVLQNLNFLNRPQMFLIFYLCTLSSNNFHVSKISYKFWSDFLLSFSINSFKFCYRSFKYSKHGHNLLHVKNFATVSHIQRHDR